MVSLCLICFLTYFTTTINSLPIRYQNDDIVTITKVLNDIKEVTADNETTNEIEAKENKINTVSGMESLYLFNDNSIIGSSETMGRYSIRPGMVVTRYDIEIEVNKGAGTFNGRVIASVNIINPNTRDDPIKFYVEGLDIRSVTYAIGGGSSFDNADRDINDGIMEIFPEKSATLYTFIFEYSGSLNRFGSGLFIGSHDDIDYIAMNLHATNARRVFPCMDEPTEPSTISFKFNNMDYNNLVSNSLLMDNSPNQFRPLPGPAHLWGMVAHNFQTVVTIPNANVFLYARSLTSNQENQAAVALSNYYRAFNEWTNKPFTEIIMDQTDSLNVIALPDISRDWYGLSTVCIWEPYVMMELHSSVKQRKTALVAIAEAMSRQWFGNVVYPENWRYQWIISGLGIYAAYDVVKEFQSNPIGVDDSLIDMDTIFTTDVIQESLYYDAYSTAQILEPESNIFAENDIRFHMSDILKKKSPAIMRMLRLLLGGEQDDFIRSGAQALLNQRSLQTVNKFNFFDSINSEYLASGSGMISDLNEYFQPWLSSSGYPVLQVEMRLGGGIRISQERFGFSTAPQVNFIIPITYTTGRNPKFDDIYPSSVLEDANKPLEFFLEEDEWVIFNIQGQGYYRVNYIENLWERIIAALEDPERREEIHPLNRAALLDDSLNLARSGHLGYDIAFRIALTMEHETHYAVWKAFVRNMEFIMKNFEALAAEDEERNPDIYLRMLQRAVRLVESEIGFYPETSLNEPAMTSLTRGLVMEHACRAHYQPCVAAAIDWFYDPNNNEVVNPNIPYDIRPAVYCTMVREGDEEVIKALYERLEIEASLYERVVILESLACSSDRDVINTLLQETIENNSPYNVEERSKIFAAVAKAGHENTRLAFTFLQRNVNAVRDTYGGPEKLEEALFALSYNMVGQSLVADFSAFLTSTLNNLQDSESAAHRAGDRIREDLIWWTSGRIQDAYDWIEENDAPTIFISTFLITICLLITLFNN